MRFDINNTASKASNAFGRSSLEKLWNQMASKSTDMGRISHFSTQRLLIHSHPVFRVEGRCTYKKLKPAALSSKETKFTCRCRILHHTWEFQGTTNLQLRCVLDSRWPQAQSSLECRTWSKSLVHKISLDTTLSSWQYYYLKLWERALRSKDQW